MFVSTSDADGTLLYEAGTSGLEPAGQVFDGDGGDLWARRGDSLYFVRHHTDPSGTPVATLAIRHPDGSITGVEEIPGRVSSVVPTDTAVHVVSQSPDSVHVSAVRSDGSISTAHLAGTSDAAAVAGPDGHLYLALMDPATGGVNTIIEISPDGIQRVVAAGIGQVFVRAHESGAVLLTTTNTTPDGEDTTTITAIHGNSTVDGARVDGTPISVHFDRTGAAHLPMLTTDPETGGDPLISLAMSVPTPRPWCRLPSPESRPGPAIAHDGRTYLPLTRFCPETRWPKTTLIVFARTVRLSKPPSSTAIRRMAPVITPDNDVILLTHDADSTTIRPIRMTVDSERQPGNPAPAMVFDVTPDHFGHQPGNRRRVGVGGNCVRQCPRPEPPDHGLPGGTRFRQRHICFHADSGSAPRGHRIRSPRLRGPGFRRVGFVHGDLGERPARTRECSRDTRIGCAPEVSAHQTGEHNSR